MADLYKTNAGLKELARRHPDNQLLSGRGPPGTHDVDLAMSVLNAVLAINNGPKSTVDLPIFEKSLCDGEGDRSSETIKLEGPIDVFILEGWSVGFGSLSADDLTKRYNEAAGSNQKRYFSEQSLESLSTINDHLSDFAMKVYPLISTVVQIEPTTYEYVFRWRLQQEHVMKAKNGGKGMTDEQVHAFVERYMPGYELWKEGIWADGAPWAGKGLRVFFGEEREVLRVVKPTASIETNGDSADNTARTSTAAPSGLSSASLPTSTTPSPLTPTKSLNTVDTQDSASITPATPSKPFDPSYSRKFLGGKSPLNPTYDQVPSLATLHQDSIILRCTSHLVFFPMQGPGGRLGVHPVNKKGRMPVGGEGYLSGGVELADFAVELFEVDRGVRVALAGEDGVVRVWRVGEEGVQGGGPEPGLVLKGKL